MLAAALAGAAFGTVKGCESVGADFHNQLDEKIEQIYGKQLIEEVNCAAKKNPQVKAKIFALEDAVDGVERASVELGRAISEHRERRA